MHQISLDAYKSRRSVRSSVEREFILIGESLRRISGLNESLFHSMSKARTIVDFKHLLAHDYGAIDDEAVYGVVYSDLILLKAEVAQLLVQDPPPG